MPADNIAPAFNIGLCGLSVWRVEKVFQIKIKNSKIYTYKYAQ